MSTGPIEVTTPWIIVDKSRVDQTAVDEPAADRDDGQESSRVDEELRLLHNPRRARCLDVQCNAHCRLCTVGLRRTKRHCSSQFREYVATNYRSKRRILGRVSVYSRYSILLSSVQTGPMHADSEWLCIGTKIKS